MPSDATLKQYRAVYDRLVRDSKATNLEGLYKYITDYDGKQTTVRMYLNSIIGLKRHGLLPMEGDVKQFEDKRDGLTVSLDTKKRLDNLSESQRETLDTVNLQDLQDGVNRLNLLKTKSIRDLEDYLTLAILVQYPLRNDLIDLKIARTRVTVPETGNYILIPKTGSSRIYLREYKTAEANGPISINITDNSINSALRSLPTGRVYLLQTKQSNPISSSDFTHRLSRIGERLFGQRIGTTTIRKIYLSDKYSSTLQDMKRDAAVMGHGLSMQQSTYIRNT
jgi:hypothetical protein